MEDIRDNKGFSGFFTQPRVNAMLAHGLSVNSEEAIKLELMVETILNNVMDGVFEAINLRRSDNTKPLDLKVDFSDVKDIDIKLEVIRRIKALGYVVKVAVDTDEEVDLIAELEELSDGDEDYGDALDDFYDSQDEYFITWDLESLLKDNEED